MRSYLTIFGMAAANPHLFDGLDVPEGIDKQTVVDNILLEGMDLEVLYADPVFLQSAISVWAAKQLPVWEHLYETTQYEYDPIENYDRHEEYVEPVTVRTDTGSGTDTVEGYTSGFNSGSGAASTPHDKTLTKPGATYTSKIASATNGDMTSTGHIHGNIGTVTSQQMIREERDVAAFNVADLIVQEFKQRFLLMIY